MLQFLLKYPLVVFTRGEFALLSTWPKWILGLLVLAIGGALAGMLRAHLPNAAPRVKNWRAGIIWLLQFGVAAVLLILLWQPAMIITELEPQKNIIAVVVDDSRSMSTEEDGASRLARAVSTLEGGVLADLQKYFQVRLYRLDSHLTRISSLDQLRASTPVTRVGAGLEQLAEETADLPIGAAVLLSDGSDNTGGVDRETIAALRNRRIPVHTVGFGREQTPQDVEIDDAIVVPRALADSRLSATLRFHQRGYAGHKSTLTVRDGDKVLAAREIVLAKDGIGQSEGLMFNAGGAGAKSLRFGINLLPGETNAANNSVTRVVNVDGGRRRILYVEGEPRWEYKFIRRAQTDDAVVQLVSMLRTTENKIYRQGIDDPRELAGGFPATSDQLFAYQAVIIGSMEADYFTPAQRDLLMQFVDRRGGGLLWLGGRSALADGGWGASGLADLLPVVLPSRKGTFHRDKATVELTPAGMDSIICRLSEDPAGNAVRWKKLPDIVDYEDPGIPKPGAAELVQMNVGGRKMPLLITQNFGRGRTAVLATGGTWHWQMTLPLADHAHEFFWQQLLRWLVADTPGRVVASLESPMLFDAGHVNISAQVSDKAYQPAADANTQAHISGPEGTAATLAMTPDQNTAGLFHAEWDAAKPGSYRVDISAKRGDEDLGSDALTFQRMDGVAENFHIEQNRELLERLAAETGGRYWQPQDLGHLAREIPYSEAGISFRQTKELWNMPAVFLLILGLCCAEWLLRRRWGIV